MQFSSFNMSGNTIIFEDKQYWAQKQLKNFQNYKPREKFWSLNIHSMSWHNYTIPWLLKLLNCFHVFSFCGEICTCLVFVGCNSYHVFSLVKDMGEMEKVTTWFFHTIIVLAPCEARTFLVHSTRVQIFDDLREKTHKFSIIF